MKRPGPMGWLAVRSRRFWGVMALLLPVLYIGSFGPACWWTAVPFDISMQSPPPQAMVIYWPLGLLASHSESPLGKLTSKWMCYGQRPGTAVRVPTDPRNTSWHESGTVANNEWHEFSPAGAAENQPEDTDLVGEAFVQTGSLVAPPELRSTRGVPPADSDDAQDDQWNRRSGDRAVALSPAADSGATWVEQRENACVLHEFGDRADNWRRGIKVWFGNAQEFRCCFYSGLSPLNRQAISAGGMVDRNDATEPLHYGYSIAFFDANGTLIACEGGRPPEWDTHDSVTCLMPLPKDVARQVAAYKVAYYESDRRIGETRQKATAQVSLHRDGQVIEKEWPEWKSDGELRGTPYQIRIGSRPLSAGDNANWRAETKEGTCVLRKAVPRQENGRVIPRAKREEQRFAVSVGESLELKVDCKVDIGTDNTIQLWVKTLKTDKKLFGELYAAFFDQHGNLVGSTSRALETRKDHGTWEVHEGALPVAIPVGFEETITSYKITVYQSERPIGEASR